MEEGDRLRTKFSSSTNLKGTFKLESTSFSPELLRGIYFQIGNELKENKELFF